MPGEDSQAGRWVVRWGGIASESGDAPLTRVMDVGKILLHGLKNVAHAVASVLRAHRAGVIVAMMRVRRFVSASSRYQAWRKLRGLCLCCAKNATAKFSAGRKPSCSS